MNLLLLSGFLGQNQDWDPALGALARPHDRVLKISVSQDWDFRREPHWEDWTRATLERLRAVGLGEPWWGVGYSLGGRLLTSLVSADPSLFIGAAFLSTHPGLKTIAEREARLLHDEGWARRFETEAWDSCLRDWNQQGVFSRGAPEPPRLERDYSRERLAAVLRTFSLAKQVDYLAKDCGISELWLAGENDEKFVKLLPPAGDLSERRNEIVPRAAHRLLIDQPVWTGERVGAWVRSVARC